MTQIAHDESRSTRDLRRPQRRPDEVRRLLLDAARKVFSELGYGGATTRRIAAEAGVVDASLFRHFGSKAAIFDAAVAEPLRLAFAELIAAFARDGYGLRSHDPAQGAAYYVKHMSAFLTEQRQSLLALITANAYAYDETSLESGLFGALFDQLEADVQVEAQAHRWNGIDVAVATRIAFGIVAAPTVLDHWLFGTGANRPSQERVAREMAEFIARGMTRTGDAAGSAPVGSALGSLDAESAHLHIRRDGAVATVTMRPRGDRNILTPAIMAELAQALDQLSTQPGIRAVILTGSGDHFSAGLGENPPGLEIRRRFQQLARQLHATTLPLIAAVNATAAGAGVTLAGLCDLTLLADTAELAEPHIALALVAGDEPILDRPFLARLLANGPHLLTGQTIGPHEAEQLNLVYQALPVEQLLPEARALATHIVDLPVDHHHEIKRLLERRARAGARALDTTGLGP